MSRDSTQGVRVFTKSELLAVLFCVSAGMSGCDGSGGKGDLTANGGSSSSGSGSNSGGATTPNASPGGIWKGTESVSGTSVFGVSDEVGDFYFLRSDGVLYIGTATTTADALSGSFDGFVTSGSAFPDGSTHGTGTLSGTIQPRVSITSKFQFATDNAITSTGSLSLTFDSLYDNASSLAAISGNFTSSIDAAVVTIGSNGTIFSQDTTSGCVLNGTVYIINASYDAYRVVFEFSSCQGQAAASNGAQFTGLAALDTSVSPHVVHIAATGASAGKKYAMAFDLTGS